MARNGSEVNQFVKFEIKTLSGCVSFPRRRESRITWVREQSKISTKASIKKQSLLSKLIFVGLDSLINKSAPGFPPEFILDPIGDGNDTQPTSPP